MQRQIKFRFWDLKNNTWVKQMGLYDDGLIGDFSECFHNIAGKNGKYFVAQQFTGLQDKNGRDIYEGDILKIEITDEVVPANNGRKINASVRWDAFYARWITEGKIEKGLLDGEQYPFGCNENCYVDYYSSDSVNAKIIGNIFENKELLS